MRQTKKGNNYHFGMKAHIGVNADSGVVHTVISTQANVHDVTQALDLLHGQESDAYGDSGYRGVEERQQPESNETEKSQVTTSPQWHTAMMPSKRAKFKSIKEDCVMAQTLDKIEKLKASICAKVEHPFHIIKNLFKYKKTSYRGIAKNAARHTMLFALANLLIVKKSLLAPEHCRVQKVRWAAKYDYIELKCI